MLAILNLKILMHAHTFGVLITKELCREVITVLKAKNLLLPISMCAASNIARQEIKLSGRHRLGVWEVLHEKPLAKGPLVARNSIMLAYDGVSLSIECAYIKCSF